MSPYGVTNPSGTRLVVSITSLMSACSILATMRLRNVAVYGITKSSCPMCSLPHRRIAAGEATTTLAQGIAADCRTVAGAHRARSPDHRAGGRRESRIEGKTIGEPRA